VAHQSLNRTGSVREDHVGIGADKPDRSHNNHQNQSQHDRVFRDALPVIVSPRFSENLTRYCSVASHNFTIKLPIVLVFEFGN
jgi:hypothetical protein